MGRLGMPAKKSSAQMCAVKVLQPKDSDAGWMSDTGREK